MIICITESERLRGGDSYDVIKKIKIKDKQSKRRFNQESLRNNTSLLPGLQ